MNRHFQSYSTLPADALGPPMRAEPAKPQDGPWKPLSPGYESRTLVGGAVEVRSTGVSAQDLKQYVEPAKKAAESIITPLAPSAGVVADAPIEWRDGAPPEKGWREVDAFGRNGDAYAYFNGDFWSWATGGENDFNRQLYVTSMGLTNGLMRYSIEHISWRGPRLVGADWPEPQA